MNSERFRLTLRDKRLVAAIVVRRLLSAEHLVKLGFFGSAVRANARLRCLRSAGLLRLVETDIGAPATRFHEVAPKAAGLVAAALDMDATEAMRLCRRSISPSQLAHSVRQVELECSFVKAWRQDPSALQLNWQPEILCHHSYARVCHGHTVHRTFKPDALLQLTQDGSLRNFFVEVDLGHVSAAKLRGKLESYSDYSGGVFQAAYGHPNFAVLFATTTSRRLKHLLALTSARQPLVLCSTFSLLERLGPFGSVWLSRSSDRPMGLLDEEVVR